MGRSLLILAAIGAALVLTRHQDTDNNGLRGWPWLMLGLGLQVLWVRFLSREVAPPATLHWLPALALLPAVRFLWLNQRYHGLWIVAAGAGLNLVVMACNGGLMPIGPGSLHALAATTVRSGVALALSKDRLLDDGSAHLAYLDDRLVLAVAGLHIACSPGDLLVAAGCLATLGEEVWRAARDARGAVPWRCCADRGADVPGVAGRA